MGVLGAPRAAGATGATACKLKCQRYAFAERASCYDTCFAQGTCATGADYCAGTGSFGCNGNGACFCATTTEGGTVCANNTDGYCGQCTSSAQCDPGEVCILDSGSGCSCDTGQGFCEPLCS